jgi:uncharacterized SAM-binding protein YcdF (DUF218 family)
MELALVAFLFLLFGKRKTSAVFLSLSMLLLWVAATPIVAETLMGRLEKDYPAVMMTEVPLARCIVLLGGAVEPVMPPRMDIDMLEAADRVRKAAQLYRAKRAGLIIVSGGNQPWSPFAEPEAASIATLLQEWGVPPSAIVLEASSRNTRENAVNSADLINKEGCGAPLLVTSAAHMKRSLAVFKKLGISALPVSADVRVVKRPHLTFVDFLPDVRALKMSNDAMREWTGQLFYKIQGWS